MILFFDGSVIKHGPQRRRPGREFLSLVKRLGAHLADVVHTHQTGRMARSAGESSAGSAADSCGTGNGRLIRDTPVIERKPRSNSLINSSRNIQHSLIRQPPRRADGSARQGFAGQNRLREDLEFKRFRRPISDFRPCCVNETGPAWPSPFSLCHVCLLLHYVQLLAKLDKQGLNARQIFALYKRFVILGDHSMKKSLLALAALGAFAGVAHAQSSVTLYGIIDEGFNINTNSGGKHLYNLSSGVLQGSRFGLRGTEDLGGGLKAIFVLENGFDVNNGKLGQGGLMFGRQAYVGLSSQFGTVTLGRQYDSVVDYVGPLEAGDNGAATSLLTRATSTTSTTRTAPTTRSSTRARTTTA
jgi:Outer membrane protein (porin)